ncbi:hypothetical protein SESBI_25216 [Sesbania bispinosa]|nr:hypothetical protein SESBI_25216 [Sesbania bispinosa]
MERKKGKINYQKRKRVDQEKRTTERRLATAGKAQDSRTLFTTKMKAPLFGLQKDYIVLT